MRQADRLRRSLLFVPGSDARKMERALTVGADTVLLDLEDSVAVDRKDDARRLVADLLERGDFGGAEPAVRINPLGTPFFDEDLSAVVTAGAHAVMLPKVLTAENVTEVAERTSRLHTGSRESVRLLPLLETAAGIVHAAEIGAIDSRVDALCFGHADLAMELGLADADPSTGTLLHARCTVALAAKACGVAPIDNVCLAIKDEQALREDVLTGIKLGFEGKLCIHPAQVAVANELYTPSAEQIARAERVLQAWDEAREAGRAVFALDGKMVDQPIITMHRRVLDRARRAGATTGSS